MIPNLQQSAILVKFKGRKFHVEKGKTRGLQQKRRSDFLNYSLEDHHVRWQWWWIGLPVNFARQQGKWKPTVDGNVTPFEPFDLSDLVFNALEWRAALAQSAAAWLAPSICHLTFWSSPHICTVVGHRSVNVHLVVSHPRHGGWQQLKEVSPGMQCVLWKW